MAGDGERIAGPGQRRDRVVDRAAAQQRVVARWIEAGAPADALLDETVEPDAGDAQAADGVAGVDALAVEDREPPDDLRAGTPCLRPSTFATSRREGRAAVLVGGREPALLHLGDPGRPERVGEQQAAGDEQDVPHTPRPPPAAPARAPTRRRATGGPIAAGLRTCCRRASAARLAVG